MRKKVNLNHINNTIFVEIINNLCNKHRINKLEWKTH